MTEKNSSGEGIARGGKKWGNRGKRPTKRRGSPPISRVLSTGDTSRRRRRAIIPLGAPLPKRSSSLPGGSASSVDAPLFGLATDGVCRAGPVARTAVGSYPTFSPLPGVRRHGIFFFIANGVIDRLPAQRLAHDNHLRDDGVVGIHLGGPLGDDFGLGIAALSNELVVVVHHAGQLFADLDFQLAMVIHLFVNGPIVLVGLDLGEIGLNELLRLEIGRAHV